MHFLNPWLLLGTLGVAVPIAIHLLNRYRYRQVEWGAMELLRRAVVIRSRRVRLEDVLLLCLRCLAILLLALALARPTLTTAVVPGQADVGAVVAVDASFSMGHRPGAHSRFDRAASRVRDVLGSLRPGSPATLVLMGERPRVLLRNVGYDPDRFEETLKGAAPLPERLHLEPCLDELGHLVEELEAPARECYLVSDAQATTWGMPSEGARQGLGRLAALGRLFFLPVAAGGAENVALVRFQRQSGLVRKGETARFVVEVRNTGLRSRDNLAVGLLVDGVAVDQRVVERLGPGESASVSLFARFDREGLARLSVRLGPDELAPDNARYAVAEVRGRTRVLYARAPSAEADEEGVDYVLAALTARPAAGLAVDAISWLDLPNRRLSGYEVVVLANVPDLPPDVARSLFHFVRQGGGLVLLLGDNTQPVVFNAVMQQQGVSLLPARLVEEGGKGSAQSEVGWAVEPDTHPLASVLANVSPEVVRQARVYRRVGLELGEGGRAVLRLSGGGPLLVEKTVGRGRVVLFASAAERSWTNMVVEPALVPMLLHEAITWLGRRAHEQPLTVSEPLSLPLPAPEGTLVREVTVRDPAGRSVTLPAVLRDGQTWAELPQVEQPGFYEVRHATDGPPLVVAVNVSPQESDVRGLTGAALAESLAGVDLRIVDEGEDVGAAVREGRVGRELWRELLVGAVAVLLLESSLAWWFTRQSRPPGA